MNLAHLLTFSVALTIAVASPGPAVAAVVARALGSGFRRTLPIIGGLILGDIVYISAAIGGLAALATTFGEVFIVVRWLGAAYLIYLAIRLWRSRSDGNQSEAERPGGSAVQVFLAGLSITLGNPKVMVFYLALLPALIDLRTVGIAEYCAMIAIVAVVLTLVMGTYAALAGRARRFLATPGRRKLIDRIAGSFMAGAAAAIIAR
jgi:threonine/homoserine/homoserine lactone efflux protein